MSDKFYSVKDIRIRDPYVVAENGVYYMYASTGSTAIEGRDIAVEGTLEMVVFCSTDRISWSEPKTVFRYVPTADSAIKEELWAPEVHKYGGKFYAFLSLKNSTGKRGTYAAVADAPDGEFTLLSETPITPIERSCIDGTLYVEDGKPYMVYSYDWPDNFLPDRGVHMGEIWAIKMKEDLSAGVGEPFRLFSSEESPVSKATPHHMVYYDKPVVRYGSDAPFLQRLADGTLYLTWSPYLQNNYVVLGAVSQSGKLAGPWKHLTTPLYDQNGGHAMFFTDFDGTRKMCIHQPEKFPLERMLCLEVKEEDGHLVLA